MQCSAPGTQLQSYAPLRLLSETIRDWQIFMENLWSFLRCYDCDKLGGYICMIESKDPVFYFVSSSCGRRLAHHRLDDTFTRYVSSLPNMDDSETCPLQQRNHLRLSTLHCAAGGHHVEVLMSHE